MDTYANTQAAGLERLVAPPKEYDKIVALPEAYVKLKLARLQRLNELSDICEFVRTASLIECKFIVNELIERVSTELGCADKLEDAAHELTRAIELESLK